MHRSLAAAASVLVPLLLVGCSSHLDRSTTECVKTCDLGRARADLQKKPITDKKDREYLLQKLNTAILSLDDGYAYAQDNSMNEVFTVLRTQGLNKDRTIAAAVLYDGVLLWKGEPFEQALAFDYVATHFAVLGDWGNARAAATGALFPLKDFGKNEKGGAITTEDLIKKKDLWDDKKKDELKESGYVVADTNFALGYMMAGVANQQMGIETGDPSRSTESHDYFLRAQRINPDLSALTDLMTDNGYNTLLLVSYGKGPEKYGRGEDNAIADFRPLTPSDTRGLNVTMNGQTAVLPLVCDVNSMAADHQWKNLEDVRKAKSVIGDVLIGVGAGTAAYSAYNNSGSDAGAFIGLGMMIAGAAAKASAHADCSYCEVIPQRYYLVPLPIYEPNTTVELSVDGVPGSKLVLAGLSPPTGKTAQVRVVRLPLDSTK